MYIKSDFGLEVTVIEILKYILLFSGENHYQEWGTNYQVLGTKIILPSAFER